MSDAGNTFRSSTEQSLNTSPKKYIEGDDSGSLKLWTKPGGQLPLTRRGPSVPPKTCHYNPRLSVVKTREREKKSKWDKGFLFFLNVII